MRTALLTDPQPPPETQQQIPPRPVPWPFIGLYCFLAILFCGLVLQFQYFVGNDGVYYLRMGENIFKGKSIVFELGEPSALRPPFYPFLIGLTNLLLHNLELSGYIVSILAFSLGVIPVFLAAQIVYSPTAAHCACILYITNGTLLLHASAVLSEPLFTSLVLLQFYFTQRIIRSGENQFLPRLAVLMGAAAGLAYLTRPEGFLFYLAGTASILLLRRKSWKAAFVSSVIFLVFFVPQFLFFYRHSHRMELSPLVTENLIMRDLQSHHPEGHLGGEKILRGLSEDKTSLRLHELLNQFRLADYLAKDHFAVFRTALASFPHRLLEFNKYLFCGFGFFLIGVGLLRRRWDSPRTKSEIVSLLFVLTFVPKLFAVAAPRFFVHYIPFFLIWMGTGIEAVAAWAEESFGLGFRKSKYLILGLCLALILFSGGYIYAVAHKNMMPYEKKDLGKWMKDHIPNIEQEYLASYEPSVNFYSGAKLFKLPYVERLEDLQVYMAHHKARYVVVSSDMQSVFLKAYEKLLKQQDIPSFFRLVRSVRGNTSVFLYEITHNDVPESTPRFDSIRREISGG